jgi:pre-mRNA cleavage complex 2 protein Pcf11
VDSGSWIRGAAAEAAEATGPSFVDAVAAEREAREVLENCSAPVDETQKTCALSGEPFETFWNAEEEEWHYRGAVVLKKTIGSVPAGALALATAVPRASENDIAAAGDEDEDEDATPSPKKAASPAKRKRAPAVKSEPVAAIKAEPLEDEGAQPAKRRSARRG